MVGIYDVPRIGHHTRITMKKDILYPLRKLHGCMYEARKSKKAAIELKRQLLKTDKGTPFFVLSPTHGNMGDHAIAEAVTTMLTELKLGYTEVTTKQLSLLNRHGYMNVMDGHLILVNGGGNLGTLWPEVEKLFRKLIIKNPKASIICLPNTIFYEESEYGEKEKQKSQRIYNAHSNLILCAREQVSYNVMKPLYKNVVLIPDMALSLNHCIEWQSRSGCMLCLRADREKTLTAVMENEINEQARKLFGDNVWHSDMNIGVPVEIFEREAELEEKYAEFRSAELVITDRLHGMIFAAITGTPCIVVNSKSHKVKGCYEWIKYLEYIKFADDAKQIELIYRSIPKKEYEYNHEKLNSYYDQLKNIIQKEMRMFTSCR